MSFTTFLEGARGIKVSEVGPGAGDDWQAGKRVSSMSDAAISEGALKALYDKRCEAAKAVKFASTNCGYYEALGYFDGISFAMNFSVVVEYLSAYESGRMRGVTTALKHV